MKKNIKLNHAFTMVELIFVIVIIGVLSSVALPKFRGLTNNAKISAEIATMSAVATALESINGEWIINENVFTWGIGDNKSDDTSLFKKETGYPISLNINNTFDRIIKENSNEYKNQTPTNTTFSIFTGPASNKNKGVSSPTDKENKPDNNDFWFYAFYENKCQVTCTNCTTKTVYYGDFVLIDVSGTGITDYSSITCTPIP